jgi:hypothetical protein
MKNPLFIKFREKVIKSEISQRDISPLVWGCLPIEEKTLKCKKRGIYTNIENEMHNTRKLK